MEKRARWAIAALLTGMTAFAAPVSAAPEHVVNGGFETGDFSGWTQTGETAFNGVLCGAGAPTVQSGNCSAFFGPFSSMGGIEQSINVGSAGVPWMLSFALKSDSGTPSTFMANFGGQTLLSLLDASDDSYAVYRFGGLTTAANMTLSFDFLDQGGLLLLDSVSLAVPEPASLGLLGAGLAGLLFARRRKNA